MCVHAEGCACMQRGARAHTHTHIHTEQPVKEHPEGIAYISLLSQDRKLDRMSENI